VVAAIPDGLGIADHLTSFAFEDHEIVAALQGNFG
jgi:hypothetical protein